MLLAVCGCCDDGLFIRWFAALALCRFAVESWLVASRIGFSAACCRSLATSRVMSFNSGFCIRFSVSRSRIWLTRPASCIVCDVLVACWLVMRSS